MVLQFANKGTGLMELKEFGNSSYTTENPNLIVHEVMSKDDPNEVEYYYLAVPNTPDSLPSLSLQAIAGDRLAKEESPTSTTEIRVPGRTGTGTYGRDNLSDTRIHYAQRNVTGLYADQIGADCYAKDAMATVHYAQQLFSQ